jgi:hypothetical protein
MTSAILMTRLWPGTVHVHSSRGFDYELCKFLFGWLYFVCFVKNKFMNIACTSD